MSIDWFTVVAQLFNFIILVGLMKHFLYQPIHNAIETRETRIEKELSDANAQKNEATLERDAFQKKNKDFEHQRAEQQRVVRDEVKIERERLLDAVGKEADRRRVKAQEGLINEVHTLKKSICNRTQQEVFAIARKALLDLATKGLEESILDVFMGLLETVDNKEKEVFSEALKIATTPALVSTVFDLTEEQRTRIQNAIEKSFDTEIDIKFVVAPDLIGGIAFSTNGYKITWNIGAYLSSMEKSIDELVKAKDTTVTKVETKSTEVRFEKGANSHGY
jgi:F-type H+-transporting ATPase subunit b